MEFQISVCEMANFLGGGMGWCNVMYRWHSSFPNYSGFHVSIIVGSYYSLVSVNGYKNNNNRLRPFVCDYPDELVLQQTFTNSHLSWSSTILYQLPLLRSIASPCSIAQCLFKSYLVYLLVWNPPRHTWYISLPSHIVSPYHRNLFCCSTKIMSFIPSLPLNSTWSSFTLTPHIHLTILISSCWNARSHFCATYYFAHNCCTVNG